MDDDLFFSVRMEKTLNKLGYGADVAANEEAAIARSAECDYALAIVNFGSDHLAAARLVERLKAGASPPTVLGFISHTWIPQVRPNAMAAGCDLLVANSAIVSKLPQLVAKLAPLDGAGIDTKDAGRLAAEDE